MFGNIWLSSALIVTAIFSASAMYKSYSDIQEAKQIQENYEIISEIKTLLAKQYNKNPQDITRDEIIANLPKGENWEKVLLLDRNKNSTLTNKEAINSKGNLEISSDEKLKLLALKAKLKNITDISTITADTTTKKYTFPIGKIEQNSVITDSDIEDSLTRAIHSLSESILYTTGSNKQEVLNSIVEEFTPYDKLYFNFLNQNETEINPDTLKDRQKAYFKTKIKEKLYLNENALDSRLYKELKDIL